MDVTEYAVIFIRILFYYNDNILIKLKLEYLNKWINIFLESTELN